MREFTENGLEGCSRTCASVSYGVVMVFVVIPLFVTGLYKWALSIMFVGLCFPLITLAFLKCKKSEEWNPGSGRMNQHDQTSISSISSSTPHAPLPTRPPPPLHVPSMSPPPNPAELTPPTPTTNVPFSWSSMSLSSQLSRAYYSHGSSFSSPIIASQSRDRRNSNSSTWPSSLYLPSEPIPVVQNSPFNFTGYVDAEAARRHAANLQPPAYPEVAQDSPDLPPPLYTTPATDEASAKVFGPSSDGLPSYEAAISTWQPPADEENLSSRDDGQRTND